MKVYPPTHVDPRRSTNDPLPADYSPPLEEGILDYVREYWRSYRETIDKHFSDFAAVFTLYKGFPYDATVVRLGPNGVLIYHSPRGHGRISFRQAQEFVSGDEGFNVFGVQERLGADLVEFDFTGRLYNADTGEVAGIQAALRDALTLFWHLLPADAFERLVRDLLDASGVIERRIDPTDSTPIQADFLGSVYLSEPGGFLREEAWLFEFKHHSVGAASAALVREMEKRADQLGSEVEALCLVTSSDLTSIGRHVSTDNSRLRVWDRAVINHLLHRHSTILATYFGKYAAAVADIESEYASLRQESARLQRALRGCSVGPESFRHFEDVGTEIVRHLFHGKLDVGTVQSRTVDGVERRDLVTRNNRQSRFFERIASRFDADFVVWDFKNYGSPIGSDVVNEVAQYSNRAIGRFVVAVARKGANSGGVAAQQRQLRDSKAVLVVSDEQLVEMLNRRSADQAPEDVLEDLLDALLTGY